ncbi:DUF2520 domain-containing protein [Clostridium cibarium]|uniref:DUF2520 domain-containing protein n=1 Tax=Clostridium cibarium TaxID=2762247 RepID=A0ABR8PRR2_9CLOT|nr:DUF2520 domain-containing protein [Clostridium cibarium]
MKIGFIGAGKVGFSLGKYFSINNLMVVGYYSKNSDSAKEAARFTSTKFFENMEELIEECDTIFITTPDGVIEEIWDSIDKLSIKNKIICHCSGSLSSGVFSNIESHNAFGYSIHPMFAISDKYNSHKRLKEAFITIEGSVKYINLVNDMFVRLGNKTKIITNKDKARYHLASVVASNHFIALVEEAVTLLSEYGFNEKEAIEALYPLINNNVSNIRSKGIINSLTGPVERNDIGTIEKHINHLNNEDRELYKLMSKKLLKIAMIKNQDKCYEKIENMIGE